MTDFEKIAQELARAWCRYDSATLAKQIAEFARTVRAAERARCSRIARSFDTFLPEEAKNISIAIEKPD